jgi:hypothetical protein
MTAGLKSAGITEPLPIQASAMPGIAGVAPLRPVGRALGRYHPMVETRLASYQ